MKVIKSNYDIETGVSTVIINHKNVDYIGTAKLHPEDKNKSSQIRGGRIAHYRAYIKFLKAEIKEEKKELKTINDLIKAVSSYKNFDNESGTAKALYRQRNLKEKDIKKLEERVDSLREVIKNYIKAADNFKAKND